MRTAPRLLLPLILIALALTACYEPLDYELVITVDDAGGYEMSFDGTIGHLLLRDAQLHGAPEEHLRELRSEADAAIRNEPSVETSEYREDGVYYVRGKKAFSNTESGVIFDFEFLSAQRLPGQLTFTTRVFDEDIRADYAEFGYQHDGHIILRTGATILESNGKRGPRGLYWDNELLQQEGMRITIATP